jgi:hypothetical protein
VGKVREASGKEKFTERDSEVASMSWGAANTTESVDTRNASLRLLLVAQSQL